MFVVHSAAAVQSFVLSAAQVVVTLLQRPLAQTAGASRQSPSWFPSAAGSIVPVATCDLQVAALWSQYSPSSQSVSSQQPPVPGTQCPVVQVLLTHSFAPEHVVWSTEAHVVEAVLHWPD
jgi:hypothetical protein